MPLCEFASNRAERRSESQKVTGEAGMLAQGRNPSFSEKSKQGPADSAYIG